MFQDKIILKDEVSVSLGAVDPLLDDDVTAVKEENKEKPDECKSTAAE